MMRLLLVIIMSPLIVAPILLTSEPVLWPQWSPNGKHIAYQLQHDFTRGLFRINTDGSNQINLTNNVPGQSPTWSPDGTQIAYLVNELSGYSLHVMNADGSQDKRLLERSGGPIGLAWSPDGSKILIWSYDPTFNVNDKKLFVIHLDGSNFTQLASGDAVGYGYRWSSDGSQLAFATEGSSAIWLMKADGSDFRQIITRPQLGDWAWSPDGQKIALIYNISFVGTPHGEIAVVNADGSEFIKLVDIVVSRPNLVWSPDSSRIAYVHDADIYVMNADGSQQTNLTNTESHEWLPAWSPDGSQLSFLSDRDEVVEIYRVQANGAYPTRLTVNTGEEQNMAWSYDGGQILFESVEQPYMALYSISTDGGTPTKFSAHLDVLMFAWSHDGRKMAILHNDLDKRDLYVVNADGTELRRISSTASVDTIAWSPSRQQIAVSVSNQGVYVVDADATQLTEASRIITQSLGYGPIWSPNGSQLAFLADGIYVIDADGSNLTKFTDQGIYPPTWSPDGRQLAFFGSTEDGDAIEIQLLDVVSGIMTTLTNDVAECPGSLAWSPDGSKIAYSSGKLPSSDSPCFLTIAVSSPQAPLPPPPTATYSLHVINVDGTDHKYLAGNVGGPNWLGASWLPDSSRILFSGSSGITLINADDANRTLLSDAQTYQVSLAPDGHSIAFARDGLNILRLNVER